MAEEGGKRKARKPWWKRLLVWGARGCLAFLGGSVLLVLILRFLDPPFSAIRVQRRVASWFDPKPYAPHQTWKDLEDIAPSMGLAVIAGEDQNFPEHSGFDWAAIEKAVAHNEKSRRKRGASTVSQQTAKNLFCWESRSWLRKGAEAYFTLLIELGWSKRRILEVYLNVVEFGDGIYGVEAASQAFFRKPAKRLSPAECALLAAVLPNPHKFKANAPSPYILGRQAWILRQMQQLGGEGLVKELGK
ncbi:MAG: monofunctional biosynthetic peptidoglycan transglycosylase [Holophagaceae bacterium]|nr:monofunctional biosynthetic peptidoglycan transglycosylase [Holophagaceae bacterium]